MILGQVRGFFRDSLDSLNYKEHRDAFNFENIPSTLIDNSYHLETVDVSTSAANQLVHEFDYSLSVRIFKKGYADPAGLLDSIDVEAESVYDVLLDPNNRLGVDIKDIQPIGYQVLPVDISNDNILILKMDFIAKLLVCFG